MIVSENLSANSNGRPNGRPLLLLSPVHLIRLVQSCSAMMLPWA